MAGVAEVTDQNFQAEVLDSDIPVVVDFWAEWCQPCCVIAPVINDLATEYAGRVKVVKMNIDESPGTPGKFGIRAIPTVLAFSGGQVVQQLQGARPKGDFADMVQKLL